MIQGVIVLSSNKVSEVAENNNKESGKGSPSGIGLSIPLSYYPYKVYPSIVHLVGREHKELSDPGYLLLHLKDDVLELEKYIQDEKYRNEILEEPWNRYKITDLYELECKIKEKLDLPKHSSIRWDKVK